MSTLATQFANGQAAATFRTNLISRLTELFTIGFISETQAFSDGSPGTGEPSALTTNTHTLTGSYTNTPKAILVPKTDWNIYISSINTTTCVVGIGAYGSGATVDYDLIIISTDIPA